MFEPGIKVRRIAGRYHNMIPGDVDEITSIVWFRNTIINVNLKKFGNGHLPKNLVGVSNLNSIDENSTELEKWLYLLNT